jgi:hypothetical protein
MASKQEHRHLRPQWAGRDITEADHAQDLDREAALSEFDGKMPRHEAEGKAYSEYKRTQHAKAAAHHLRGIRLAEAAGDNREGRKHGLMYQLHLQALGHEPIGPVPKEVEQHSQGDGSEGSHKVYSFKAHRGDIFVLPDETLGKKEKSMADTNTEMQLEWERHDDNTGGFHKALDKSDRHAEYRTWAIDKGMMKPAQHVLVKFDGVKQTTLGYFDTQAEAMQKAEGEVGLRKNAAHGAGIPLGVAATAKAETGLGALKSAMGKAGNEGIAAVAAAQRQGGKEASDAMGSSGSSYGKEELSASASSSSAGGSKSASDNKPPWMRKDLTDFEAKSEGVRCGKCGSKAEACKCGNMGKAELCKRCGKAENLCKCSGMGKSEAQQKLADEEKVAHERQYALGKEVLAKVETTGSGPTGSFGLDKDGKATGVSPQELQARLHDIYVAAKFVVDKAGK